MKAIKPLWLESSSPAKSLTKAQTEEASSRVEARAVLGEITNIPQHHNRPSPSPKLHNPTSTPPLSDCDHSSTPPPLSIHMQTKPTPLSSSSYPSANSPHQNPPTPCAYPPAPCLYLPAIIPTSCLHLYSTPSSSHSHHQFKPSIRSSQHLTYIYILQIYFFRQRSNPFPLVAKKMICHD